MASIFKRSKKKNQPYWIQYTDQSGKRRTKKGYTDRGLSEQLANRLEEDVRLRLSGMIDADQEKIVEGKKALVEVVLKEFAESLDDNSTKHVQLTLSRIRTLTAGAEFMTLADIQPEEVQRFLRKHCKAKDLGNRTYNHYLQAIDSFCNWCVKTKRLLANPLLGLER